MGDYRTNGTFVLESVRGGMCNSQCSNMVHLQGDAAAVTQETLKTNAVKEMTK